VILIRTFSLIKTNYKIAASIRLLACILMGTKI